MPFCTAQIWFRPDLYNGNLDAGALNVIILSELVDQSVLLLECFCFDIMCYIIQLGVFKS